MLILLAADGFAAIIGSKLGKIRIFHKKTLEGSLAFFSVCLICSRWMINLNSYQLALISLGATFAELYSGDLDNITTLFTYYSVRYILVLIVKIKHSWYWILIFYQLFNVRIFLKTINYKKNIRNMKIYNKVFLWYIWVIVRKDVLLYILIVFLLYLFNIANLLILVMIQSFTWWAFIDSYSYLDFMASEAIYPFYASCSIQRNVVINPQWGCQLSFMIVRLKSEINSIIIGNIY